MKATNPLLPSFLNNEYVDETNIFYGKNDETNRSCQVEFYL